MNKYIVYYYIKSASLYRDSDEAEPKDNLNEVGSLLKELKSEDDLISIYTTESKIRVQIWGEKEQGYCTLEINNAHHGVNYFKKFPKEELAKLSVENLENYIAHPESHKFESEGF